MVKQKKHEKEAGSLDDFRGPKIGRIPLQLRVCVYVNRNTYQAPAEGAWLSPHREKRANTKGLAGVGWMEPASMAARRRDSEIPQLNSIQISFICVMPYCNRVISGRLNALNRSGSHSYRQLFPLRAGNKATAARESGLFKRQKPQTGHDSRIPGLIVLHE